MISKTMRILVVQHFAMGWIVYTVFNQLKMHVLH